MIKFLKIFLIILFTFNSIFISYGESGQTLGNLGELIKVKVTEKIPGVSCTKGEKDSLYTCSIKPGFSSIESLIGGIIKWFTALAAIAGVLFIVINGILLSMGGSSKDEIKKRIIKTIAGLILLLLSGLILSIIAPWVYR